MTSDNASDAEARERRPGSKRSADSELELEGGQGSSTSRSAQDGQTSPRRRRSAPRHVEPENSIRQTGRRAREPGPTQSATDRAAPAEATRQPRGDATTGPSSGKAENDPWTVPQAVRDRFVQDGHRFHFPDGAAAFKDKGRKLVTPSENTEVIHSLIQIAESRGWSQVTVSGTERFRQEAWRQARLAGLAVRGYRPSDVERGQLVRALARQQESGRTDGSEAGATKSSDAPIEGAPAARPNHRADRLAGQLLEHGRESYRFDPHEPMSYFVRLKTAEGTPTIWGKDLERAVGQSLSQPKIGDEVVLQTRGQDAVTVKRLERDEAGRVLDERDLATHRNRWSIETREFVEARAATASIVRDESMSPQEAVRQHPELAGTYLNLRATEIAARAIRDPQDQRKFIENVRSTLAASIERGDPMPAMRMRDRTSLREREQALARG